MKFINKKNINMGNYDDDNSPYDPEEDLEMMFPDEDARAELDDDGYSYPDD